MPVREKSDCPKLQLHHSPVEIERKFLVSNDEWRQFAIRSVRLRDGLIAAIQGPQGPGSDPRRSPSRDRGSVLRKRSSNIIPIADAERMLSTICRDDTLEKERFFV